jgi:hypothetical protein
VQKVSILIFADDVIRNPRDQSPITSGIALYKSLNETNRVLVIAENREKTEIWMKTHNIAKRLDDIVQLVDDPARETKLSTVDFIRSKTKITAVVTADSDLTKQLLEQGITVLVFLNPKYARPEFRPDGREGVKSWNAIVEELDKQQGLYSEDTRL